MYLCVCFGKDKALTFIGSSDTIVYVKCLKTFKWMEMAGNTR